MKNSKKKQKTKEQYFVLRKCSSIYLRLVQQLSGQNNDTRHVRCASPR